MQFGFEGGDAACLVLMSDVEFESEVLDDFETCVLALEATILKTSCRAFFFRRTWHTNIPNPWKELNIVNK